MIRIISLAIAIAIVPGIVVAADFDGSKRLICSVTEAIECDRMADCEGGSADILRAPDFFMIDLKRKTVSAESAGKTIREAKINAVQKFEDRVVFNGAIDERLWSGVLDRNYGRMTMSATDNGFAFLLFGVCRPL